MSDEHLLGPEVPDQYNFSNWDSFVCTALRYHSTRHPDNDLVHDRLETLRSFMSDDVVEHLGSLVQPQRHYQTNGTWEQWLRAAANSLRSRDKTIAAPTSAENCIASYKAGVLTERQLWTELNALAAIGEILRERQREVFWRALSWQTQDRLQQLCPYFNPRNEIWTKTNPDATHTAELELAQSLEYLKWDDVVRENTLKLRRRSWILAVLILAALTLTVIAVGTHGNATVCFASSLYGAFFWMFSLFCAFFLWDSHKSLNAACIRRDEVHQSLA